MRFINNKIVVLQASLVPKVDKPWNLQVYDVIAEFVEEVEILFGVNDFGKRHENFFADGELVFF
jgi:hypothetical protein